MVIAEVLLLGFIVGFLIGLMGIGGGIVLVPLLVYVLHMTQHAAQGTSLLVLLPPIGAGALYLYWKEKSVDLPAGLLCALGMLSGGYAGAFLAVGINPRDLKGIFAVLLMFFAGLLWRKTGSARAAGVEPRGTMANRRLQLLGVLGLGTGVGVMAGLLGVGGGALLVPLLVLLFGFEQHRAQGTSLVALVPPTGALAFLVYYKAGHVNVPYGMLLMPGMFLGGLAGSFLAQKLSAGWMRRVFAALLFLLGASQMVSAWWK
jgi:uncharacterized protein